MMLCIIYELIFWEKVRNSELQEFDTCNNGKFYELISTCIYLEENKYIKLLRWKQYFRKQNYVSYFRLILISKTKKKTTAKCLMYSCFALIAVFIYTYKYNNE